MYFSYMHMLYQAERDKTAKEQQEEDIRTGQLAAELARLWRSLGRRRSRQQRGSTGQRVYRAAVPAPRCPGD
jgi:hypothetical protein